MSRDHVVSPTRRIAFAALLVPFILTGCIFSPDQEPVDPGGGDKIDTITSPEDLVQFLAQSYRDRLIDQFASILANDPDNDAEYLFITAPAAGVADEQWGYTEEVRLHQRMFEPYNTPVGETPVPAQYWLTSVTITLTQETPFTERTDLYASAENPDGLDEQKWLAKDAIYGTNVLFDLQGEIDYQVNGQALFVIIEDLTKEVGDDGKFLLLQWNDLAAGKPDQELPS